MENLEDRNLQLEKFEQDVSLFILKETEVKNSFIEGMLVLGEYLHQCREVYKPLKKWEKFMSEIKKDRMQCNALIRTFLYVKENPEINIKDLWITNWKNLYGFVSMSTEQKEMLLDSNNEEEITSGKELEERIQDIKAETSKIDIEEGGNSVEVIEDDTEHKEHTNFLDGKSLLEYKILAKEFVSQLKQQKKPVSNNGVKFAAAYLSLVNFENNFQEAKTKNLTEEEKTFWAEAFSEKLLEISELIKQ